MRSRSKFHRSRKFILAAIGFLLVSVTIGALFLKDRPVRLFDRLPVRSNDIVLFGDSHFEFFDAAEMLGNRRIRNKGYSGQTSRDMLHRIDDIVKARPKRVLLCAGANDAFHGRGAEAYRNDMRQLIERLKEGSEAQAVMAIPPTTDSILQERIKEFNLLIEQLCSNYQIPFIDISNELSRDGLLDPAFTVDGIHLNENGYRRILPLLKPFVNG